MVNVWWARRDLRLDDNPALLAAQQQGTAAGVFAWTPARHWWSGRRRAHLARVLWSLRASTNGALTIRRGAASDVVRAAAQEVDAEVVFAAREFTPSGIREQDEVARALAREGRKLSLQGSPYAIEPDTLKTGSGNGFRVFTPFAKAWRRHGAPPPAPHASPAGFVPLDSDVDLDHEAAHGDTEDLLGFPAPFGEERARDALDSFVEQRIHAYGEDRDRPDRPGTSSLSIPLAYGELHPRTILDRAARVDSVGARTFETEIAWREFHADVLAREPHALHESLRPQLPEGFWASDDEADEHFVAWRDGTTGFPLVDAGMRQLAATGWMHNRVRMLVASVLVKDLRVPWQRGADYFRHALLDYDHSQNQLNWQWVAGTGYDASPFFRIFNPETQRRKFDPHRRYVEQWVAEIDTPAYPGPLVDHAVARENALAALAHAKRAREAKR